MDGREVKRYPLNGKQSDPGETKNNIAVNPDEANRLRTAYDQWWEGVQPMLANESVVGPKINPFKERFWKQFGGGPTPDDLKKMDPANANQFQ